MNTDGYIAHHPIKTPRTEATSQPSSFVSKVLFLRSYPLQIEHIVIPYGHAIFHRFCLRSSRLTNRLMIALRPYTQDDIGKGRYERGLNCMP
jgi:hypothetical protein